MAFLSHDPICTKYLCFQANLKANTLTLSLNSPVNLSHAAWYGLQTVPCQYDAKPKCTKMAFHKSSSKLNKSDKEGKIERIKEALGSLLLGGRMEYQCALLWLNLWKKLASNDCTDMTLFLDDYVIFHGSSGRDYQGKGKEDSMQRRSVGGL